MRAHKNTWLIIAALLTLGGVLQTSVPAQNAPGALLWQDRLDHGPRDQALDVAVGGTPVFLVGAGQNSSNPSRDWLVRAYDTSDGTLLWEDQRDEAGFADVAELVAVEGGLVFVAGTVFDAIPNSGLVNPNVVVRAYDARTGVLHWQ